MGKCEDSTWYGVKDLSVTTLEPVVANEKYYYCVKKRIAKNEMSYYELNTFFKFHLPIVGDFTSFTIEGSTADIYSMDNYTAYN